MRDLTDVLTQHLFEPLDLDMQSRRAMWLSLSYWKAIEQGKVPSRVVREAFKEREFALAHAHADFEARR